jgi:geranylgeranyl diphosphate synthase type I
MTLASLAPAYLDALEAELHLAVGSERTHQPSHAPVSPERLGEYYAMLAYHLGWGPGLAHGKRLRPLLCLLCCAGADGDWQQALPLAAAIELIHNFSLIHDDIQDNSPMRHGRPTVWSRWGAAQAINAGDAMFTLAFLAPHRLAVLGVPAETTLFVLSELKRTCLGLTQGQYLDMSFEQRECITVAEYLAMIEKKTAVLIAAATHLGACLAGASPERARAFRDYGLSLGLAFQLQDDLLGIWGDPAVTGKSAASDLEKRKKSLPVVFGLERSPEFATAYAQPHAPGDDVRRLAARLEDLGARDYVNDAAREMTSRARNAMALAAPTGPAGKALDELTHQLLTRNQ